MLPYWTTQFWSVWNKGSFGDRDFGRLFWNIYRGHIIEGLGNHALVNGESLQCFELENDMIPSMMKLRNYSDGLWRLGRIEGSLKPVDTKTDKWVLISSAYFLVSVNIIGWLLCPFSGHWYVDIRGYMDCLSCWIHSNIGYFLYFLYKILA